MSVPKSITLYTAAVCGSWIGAAIYSSQNTYIHEKYYLRGCMTFTLFGGLSCLALTHKYCPCARGL